MSYPSDLNHPLDRPSGQDPGLAARAVDGLTDARRAVDDVAGQVSDVTQRLAQTVQHPGAGVRSLLTDLTRKAPLAMLGVAFIAGALFAGRRR